MASSTNLQELLQVAPEIVCISFRLGIEAWRRAIHIEFSVESWATSVADCNLARLQAELARFHEEHVSNSETVFGDIDSELIVVGRTDI